jgi:hypothetical protein
MTHFLSGHNAPVRANRAKYRFKLDNSASPRNGFATNEGTRAMPRVANLQTVEIEGKMVFSDLSHLPLDEAVKRSETRRRNQAQAQKRRDGHIPTQRGKQTGTTSKAPPKSLLARLGLSDSEAAKSLHAAHLEKVRIHDEKLHEFTKAHTAEREELDRAHEAKLASVDGLIRMLDMARQLPDNSKIVADLEKRLASF